MERKIRKGMLMRKIIFIVFVVITGLAEIVQAKQSWMYVDVLSVKNVNAVAIRNTIEIEDGAPSVTIGDRQYDATFCAKESQFTCVKSAIFEFGIPTELTPKNQQWVVNDSRYKVVGEDTVNILGREYKILYIDRKTKDGKFRYLYSTSHGLIALVASFGNQTRSYILEGQNGFGANKASLSK